jgi:hypothetical protein
MIHSRNKCLREGTLGNPSMSLRQILTWEVDEGYQGTLLRAHGSVLEFGNGRFISTTFGGQWLFDCIGANIWTSLKLRGREEKAELLSN